MIKKNTFLACCALVMLFVSCDFSSERSKLESNASPEKTVNDFPFENHQEAFKILESKALAHYNFFQIAPDQTNISMSTENGLGLFIFNLKTNKIKQYSSTANGFNTCWLDANAIVYKERNKNFTSTVKMLHLTTNKTTSIPISSDIILSTLAAEKHYFLNKKTLDISIKKPDGSLISKLVGNQKFYKPMLSPNHELLAVHEGVYIQLYKANGNHLATIGKGLATSWSPDSKTLLYFLDVSHDGHEISNAEIFAYNVVAHKTTPLSNTKNRIEAYPFFLSDHHIIYKDLKTETNHIIPYE